MKPLSHFTVLGLVAGLLAGPAWSQCKSPLAGPSDLLFGWNDDRQDDWGGDPGPALNKDPKFVTEGSGSAMVDFTGQPTWADRTFTLDFAEPQDWSKYGIVSVDVYTPESSIGLTDQGVESDWNELWLDAGDYRGVRGVKKDGWTTLYWSLNPDNARSVSRVVIGGNTEVSFAGPLYFDNFRGYLRKAQGVAPGDRLIAGFEDDAGVKLLDSGGPVTPRRSTDAQFVTEGKSALELDLTGIKGWNPDFLKPADANLPAPVDLSQACSVLYDVYVPPDSQPAFFDIGLRLAGSDGKVLEYNPSIAPGWNTLVVPIPDDLRPSLKDVDKIWFLVASGDDDPGTWKGPVYVDAIRASGEATVMPTNPLPGDLNGDQKVDLKDATLSLQVAVQSLVPTEAQKEAGDVNHDGHWDLKDTVLILNAAVNGTSL